MDVAPVVTPVTTPVEEPTVATEVLPLLHTPPGVASVKVAVNPGHSLAVPPIAATTGSGLTVSAVVTNDVPHEPATT